MLRALYWKVKERFPFLARLIFRLHWQKFLQMRVPRGLRVESDLSSARNIRCQITGTGNVLSVGPWTVINDLQLYILGNNNRIVIGEDVRIFSGVFYIEDDNTLLEIGDGTIIKSTGIGLSETGSTIRMGKHCMIAPGVDIRNGDSHAIYDTETGQRINKAGDVILGDRVWVGVRATLLKGTQVADGCIVGACAVVAKPLMEPKSLYIGNPPRLLRGNIHWTREH